VERLTEAVADCTLVIGTGTRARRKPEQPVIPLPELAPFVGAELARGGRVALVFGPEKRGLTRDDLSLCHHLVEIPTHPRQPSMNLGQAVAVCLYELAARAGNSVAAKDPIDIAKLVSSGELERLAAVVEKTMLAANYSPAAMREANRHDLRLLLRRMALTGQDARRILGLFRRILWRLER
jgi:tRNA/rRNA methyltransferase